MEINEIAKELDDMTDMEEIVEDAKTEGSTDKVETTEKVETKEKVETDETEVKKEENPAPSAESDDELIRISSELEQIKKINNGLLQAKTGAMRKKEEAEQRLSALEEELRVLKSAPQETKEEVLDSEGIPVEFDEDGNAFIKGIPQNTQALEKKIQDLETIIKQTTTELTTSKEAVLHAESLSNFLNEKEGYKEVFPQVKEQWQYIKTELFDQFVEANGIEPPKTQAEALEITMSPEFKNVFLSKYPSGDLESVVQAGLFGGKYYERKALDSVLAKKQASSHSLIPSNKPQSLNTISGEADNGDEGLLQRVTNMPFEEYMAMSPTDEARYKRLLRAKER